MANKKRNKYPTQKKMFADARRYTIKNGEYNGGGDSSEFMVTGHSTGSPYSEMEELSNQVTRDAGGYKYREPEYASDQGETGYEMYQGEGIGDVSPELYASNYPKPSRTSRGLAIGAAVGLAATALLGGLAYMVYQNEKQVPAQRRPRKHALGVKAVGAKSAAKAVAKKRTGAKAKPVASKRASKSSRSQHSRV